MRLYGVDMPVVAVMSVGMVVVIIVEYEVDSFGGLNVGSVQNALLPFGSRFSRTCPQTVLACLHAYGSPLIT